MTKKRIVAAGFLIRSGDKFLLGRPTGHKHWSIFKGELNEGELPLEAAIRELEEETGIKLSHDVRLLTGVYPLPICTYEIKEKNKQVIVYIIDDKDGHLLGDKFICTSTFGLDNKPEIDAFKWFTFEELIEHIMPSQKDLIKTIRERFYEAD